MLKKKVDKCNFIEIMQMIKDGRIKDNVWLVDNLGNVYYTYVNQEGISIKHSNGDVVIISSTLLALDFTIVKTFSIVDILTDGIKNFPIIGIEDAYSNKVRDEDIIKNMKDLIIYISKEADYSNFNKTVYLKNLMLYHSNKIEEDDSDERFED